MAKSDRIGDDGVYRAVATMSDKRRKDDEVNDPIPFSFVPAPKPDDWSQEDYEYYLDGADLHYRAEATRPHEKARTLTPEEKAARKQAAATNRALVSLAKQAGVDTPEELEEVLRERGLLD